MTEIWKDIEGYEGYQISNFGNIRSTDRIVTKRNGVKETLQGKELKQQVSNNGYKRVKIHGHPTLYIHRAVAFAFVDGYFTNAQVNHKDENKLNNHYDNLEWITQIKNLHYGTHYSRCKETSEQLYGKAIEQYTSDGVFLKEYPSITAAANAMNVHRRRIYAVLKKKGKVKGYIFKKK